MSLLDEIRFRRAGMAADKQAPSGPRRRIGSVHARQASPRMQRASVKASYGGVKKLAGHHAYITRDGAGKDGSRADLFDAKGSCTLPEYTLEGEKLFFKLIISPEHGADLSLKDYTREVMRAIGDATGRDLIWYAADHYNTDKPHVHVVVRGVDANGKDVRFDPEFVKSGMREHAEVVATQRLGMRSAEEVELQKKHDTCAGRFTWIDRQLSALTREHSRNPYLVVKPETSLQQDRLSYLTSIGIAHAGDTLRSWDLPANWHEQLRAMGIANDKQKLVGQAIQNSPVASDFIQTPKERYVWEPSMGDLSGTVVYKDYIEQKNDTPYMVVESNHAYFLVEGKAAKQDVELGERITLYGKAESATSTSHSTPGMFSDPDHAVGRSRDDLSRPSSEKSR